MDVRHMNKYDLLQLLLQQPHQNIQFKHTVNPQSEPLVPPVPNVFHQVIILYNI